MHGNYIKPYILFIKLTRHCQHYQCLTIMMILQLILPINKNINHYYSLKLISVQLSSVTQMCLTLCKPMEGAHQASLTITNSWSLPKLMSILSVMPSNHLLQPFSSHLQSFPASGSFQMSWFFTSGGQSIAVSALASALPMNIED